MRRLVALLSLALSAQTGQIGPAPPPQRLPTLTPGKAVVVGRVVEAETTSGIGGARVSLNGDALGRVPAFFADGTPGGPRTVIADGEGRFAFRDLPAGQYVITTSASGFVGGQYGQTRIIQIPRSLDLPRKLDLSDRDRPAEVTISMWKQGGIGGIVRDEFGEPMVRVPVTVLARTTDWGGVIMQEKTSAMTDDRGMYHADVVPGDYVVAVLAATTTYPASSSDIFLGALAGGDASQRAYMQNIVAGGGVMPRGIGTRVGNLLVNQIDQNNSTPVAPVFDADGRPVFYPTTYHPASLNAPGATIVTVASGEEKAGINLDLRPIPARRVSGRVVGPNNAGAHISLRLVPADPANQRTSPAVMIDTPRALADANGDFTFIGIAHGAYRLQVIRMPGPSSPFYWNADPVTVGDTDVVNVQVALQTGAQISGRLTFDSANPPPAQAELRNMTFGLRPVPGSVGAMQTITSIERFDTAGRVTTRPVIPGPYLVNVGGVPAGWVLKSVTVGGQNAVDVPFELSPAGSSDLVITLTDRISTLQGTVRDANGRPSAAATVGVFPLSKALWRLPGIASRRVQVSLPGRDGRYSFRGLPAGDYVVIAVDGASVDFSDPAALTSLMAMPTSARVTIADAGNKTQDLSVTLVRER